jgi:2-(1,2-epoxy-1,2-dihydrophenyl)acetyl-CoA isomerase
MPAQAQPEVLLEIRDAVAHITLNRPQAGNGITAKLARALASAALACQTDASVRAVLLRGAGDAFCVGGDLKDFAARRDNISAYLLETTAHLHLAISRLARMNAPVVAAVHGAAAGGGFSLACACDLVVAAESATFVIAYSRIGLPPDGGSTYFLPRLIGLRRALELALLHPRLSAQQARDYGIVNQVVPDAELMARAAELAKTLASGPLHAFGMTKKLFHLGWSESLEAQMERESHAIAEAAAGPEGREGITSFLEKRQPKFP